MTPAELTGQVVARAVLRRAGDGAFGILLWELPEESLESFVTTLGSDASGPPPVRLAVPTAPAGRAAEVKRWAKRAGFPEHAVDTTVEGAEGWRNSSDVTETIVVVALKEVPKLRSLNRFERLGADAIYDAACDEAAEALGVNAPLVQLWGALKRRAVSQVIPFEGLLSYYAALRGVSEDLLPTRSRDLLHLLGLLPDPKLLQVAAAKKIAERLVHNAKTVDQIEVLSRVDRQRISKALATKSEREREALRDTYSRVMAFHRDQNPALLAGLTLEGVEKLLRIRPTPSTTSGDGGENGGGDAPEVEPAVRAIDYLLDGRDEEFAELADAVARAIEAHGDGEADEPRDPENGDPLAIRMDHPFLRVVERCVGPTAWGGLIDVDAATLDGALALVDKIEPLVFDPEGPEWHLRQTLANLVRAVGIDEALVTAWDEFAGARRVLVEHLRPLLLEPLVQVRSTPTYVGAAERYLDAYGRLLEGLRQSYEAIAAAAPDGVEMLCSQVLALDTIVIRSPGAYRAILSPLHPLHLWKFVELARQTRAEAGRFSDPEKDLLRRSVHDLPNFVTTLYVSNYVTRAGPRILPEAGIREGIPYYEELAQQYAGRDGFGELGRLLERFCVLYPHARFGLRIALIDPPELAHLLRELARLADTLGETLEALHVRVFFTTAMDPAVAALGGGARDEEGAERFRGVDGASRFTLEVHDGVLQVGQIAEALKEHPAHVAVLFDPSSAKTLRMTRTPSLSVHPLCLPMHFQFDIITGTVRMVPAADGGIFSDHNDLRARLSRQLTGSFFGVSADLKAQQQELAAVARGCTWLAVLDRAQEGALQFDVPRVALQRAGKRDLAVYAKSLAKFLAELDGQLRLCNYTPQPAALRSLVDALEALLGDGLLALVAPRPGGSTLDERRTRGILGVLVTAAWYREQADRSLLVSIDSPEARRWLELREDPSRADLLGIVDEDDGSITIDLLEVKTYEHPEDAYRIEGEELRGNAVDQLLNTRRIVTEIFSADPSQERVVSPQRRELLRQQLYRECLVERRSDEEKVRWKDRLNQLFAREVAVRIRLTLVVVGLTHVHEARLRVLHADGHDVRLVELAEDDVRRFVTGESAGAGTPTTDVAVPPTTPADDSPFRATDNDTPPPEAATPGLQPPVQSGLDETRRIRELAGSLRRVLQDHGVAVLSIDPDLAQLGPSVLRMRVKLGPGARLQTLRSRAEDIGRELACRSTPLIENLPGENYVGIDLERPERQIVPLASALAALPVAGELSLPLAVGVRPDGTKVILDLVQLPHLLVAGSTMSGKTVFLHAVILSLLAQHAPAQLELVLIDPKATDFIFYNGLPSVRGGVVITEPTDAIHALEHLVSHDLPERTRILQGARCPNLRDYNAANPTAPLRPIVVVIDEYADLIAVLSKADRAIFEREINRLAQRARSVGIHLVLATQRPTVDVVTGLLKANMPCRVSFRLPQRNDSQVILDQSGAENLFGQGDMLLFLNDRLVRLQGYFISRTDLDALLPTLPGARRSGQPGRR